MTPAEFISNLKFNFPSDLEVNGEKFPVNTEIPIEPGKISLAVKPLNLPTPKIKEHELDSSIKYQIYVKQYMTKPSTPTFAFHKQWNYDVPMPMRVMVGNKLAETKGMVKMSLWGEMINEQESICLKCGRSLTNPVSKYFGIGPECGNHNYVNPFETKEELQKAVEDNNKKLMAIKWTGWIIKSAILNEVIING